MSVKVIVQEPETTQASSMPKVANETGCFDYALPLDEIGPALSRFEGGSTDKN
ncbi:chemotaxis protein CheB [Singulisphaera sp. PoT]|uniref:chemotaxis protein CheB n=1 Tax=Singulisphaera sp. PoT TaxID=3411797 RepID=UPI003BF4A0B0